MACLLASPGVDTLGAVVFTTPERDQLINGFADVRRAVEQLKSRYLIGLHHNWHDHALRYDPLFDFHMAGEEDLKEVDGVSVPLVPMDACNFVPPCFEPGPPAQKFWDILFVARAVAFKGVPEFLAAVRQLYDLGHEYRILFICPVPPKVSPDLADLRQQYEKLFNQREQDLFNLLTLDFRYPFPFDLPTLAHFYRSSRTFVHSAPDERRCRVAAYAWAAGLPVVGMQGVGSILTSATRHPPYFFETDTYADFAAAIVQAVEASKVEHDFGPVSDQVATAATVGRLGAMLDTLARSRGAPGIGGIVSPVGLDIRLGRHHGLAVGGNRLEQDLGAFVRELLDPERVAADIGDAPDPEVRLAGLHSDPPRRVVTRPSLRARVRGMAAAMVAARRDGSR